MGVYNRLGWENGNRLLDWVAGGPLECLTGTQFVSEGSFEGISRHFVSSEFFLELVRLLGRLSLASH